MPRPKSEDKRNALMAAATRIIVAQGLSAPTAEIAKEAGISNGSLFTYFGTKSDLFNQLYLELKTSMALAALEGFIAKEPPRAQLERMWSNWTRWAKEHPDRHRAMVLLGVSDDVTPETRAAAGKEMAFIGALIERVRAKGAMRDAPAAYVGALTMAMSETTVDFILRDPKNADTYAKAGFEALWRILT